MKKIKAFLTVLTLALSVTAFAQDITVKGSVKDASTGETIPGAAVQIKGTSKGVAADFDGNYSISAPSNATLIFSSINYVSAEIAVNGQSTLNVTLKPDSERLEDAVVVGYGTAKRVGSIVGAISTVKSDIVKNAPAASALDQLQGQVAGLAVFTSSGVAGDDAVSMTLHGTGSLSSSSEPLFVIDGVPSSSRTIMAMNPNDIVSVTVLKDATATSIYGSRAANGVVYITTRGGAYNSKATVTVRSMYGVNTLANPQFYENMMSGDEWIDFRLRTGTMTLAAIETQFLNNGYHFNTKWHEILQNPVTAQYQNDLTFEGGGDKVAYMVSASQFHQDGQTVGNYYDRYTVRSNIQAHPASWIKFGTNFNLSYDIKQTNPNWGDSEGGPQSYTSGGLSFMNNPLYPSIDPETGKRYATKFPNGLYNPEYYIKNREDVYHRLGLNGNAYVELTLAKGLTFTSRIGTDARATLNNFNLYPSYLGASGSGQRYRSITYEHHDTFTNTLEYKFNVADDHHFTVLAGHEYLNNISDAFSASSKKQSDDRLMNLQNGTQETYSVSESFGASRFLSFFGNANYNYAEKYYFDATIRNDASSRFGFKVRHATFWAVGGMWKLSKEDFIKDIDWIQDLNFKASYGTQGNANIGNYKHLGLIGAGGKYNEVAATSVVSQPSNPSLTWEQQGLFTVGIGGRFFDKVNLEVDFYNRTTSNMLMAVPQPYTTGFSEVTANVGAMSNTGIDITLNVDILRGPDYYLNFNTVFNFNSEVVTELFDAAWDEDLQKRRWIIPNTYVAYVEGQPVSLYCPIYAGVDPEDGLPMWYVPGDDPDVTTKEKTTKVYNEDALTQNTGLKRHAPINGGFGFNGAWKGFSFKADFSYVLGKTLINNDAFFYANPNNNVAYNCSKYVSDYWTPENKNAQFPDWTKGATMQFDSHLAENASFLRFKNFQLAYSFASLFKGTSFGNVCKDIKLTATGRNLFTLTKYSGIDPEVDSNLTYGIAGNSRQFLGGIEITF